MPRAALMGFVIYVALAFGLRSYLQWRRTGHTGFVGLSGRPGSPEWLGGALLVVALIGGAASPLLAMNGVLPAWPVGRGVHLVGLVLTSIGIAATLWAQLAMGDSWRIGVDPNARTTLVVGGPFERVRNPIYSAMLLATTGLALMVPNLASVLALAALVVGLEIHVRLVEEPYLLRTHGEHYRSYAARTGRFVPGVGCSI
jgi:protein-S-isoprenylcysteine O-methyltransferase Ste14